MAESIAFVHHKGGTGKTTSCINVAGHLADAGKRVLVVDLDPQGNATTGLRIDKNKLKYSMYNVIISGTTMDNAIVKTEFENLHVAPSAFELAWVEMDGKKINTVSHSLKDIEKNYDYILIDTPPSLGKLMISGIVASDYVITTLDVGIFALDGMETMQKVFDAVKNEAGKKVGSDMIILTKTKESSPISKILRMKNPTDEVKKSLRSKFRFEKRKIHMVPNDKNVYEAQMQGEPLSHFSPRSKASIAYKKIAKEIMKWN